MAVGLVGMDERLPAFAVDLGVRQAGVVAEGPVDEEVVAVRVVLPDERRDRVGDGAEAFLGRAASSGPSMSVNGVRNSCETLEKNSVFARSSSARRSSRWR